MSNKARFSLVILSAILLSACTAPKSPTGTNNNQAVEEKPTPTEQNQTLSVRDLLTAGKNQKCTVSLSETNEKGAKTDTQGTIYISGKKMAEEIAVTSTDKSMPSVNMRMISDGAYMYTWDVESKAKGMKIKMTEPIGTADNTKPANSGVNLDEKVNMKCSVWLVDDSKFTVPTDVTFTDLSEMMKNIPTAPAGVKSPK